MAIALRLKKQWPSDYGKFIIGIPDLHLRKAMMLSICGKFEDLGLKHLANMCGYKEDQFNFLRKCSSIHKTFAFVERVVHAMLLALNWEFMDSLGKEKRAQFISGIADKQNINCLLEYNRCLESYIIEGCANDEVFAKNCDLLDLLNLVYCHYLAERTQNYSLKMACIKDFLPYAVVSNCSCYGPLLIELLVEDNKMQLRYRDILKRGYFSFRLRNTSDSEFVGWDAVAEDINLQCGHFRHSRQTVEQAIILSDMVQEVSKNVRDIYSSLGMKEPSGNHIMKDDRATVNRMVQCLMNVNSFKCSGRKLMNEFDDQAKASKMIYNHLILKKHYMPLSKFLIARYMDVNKLGSIDMNKVEVSANENIYDTFKKVKKGISVVINLKAITPGKKSANVEVAERMSKKIANQLRWEDSPYNMAAAITDHDGSKRKSDKAKIKAVFKRLPSASEFFLLAYPNHIKFDVVAYDAQHTLFHTPQGAKSGVEYVKFLGKQYWDVHYNLGASIIYWCYDLRDIVRASVPKVMEQSNRDKSKSEAFSKTRLLGKASFITDESIEEEWKIVTTSREIRNQVARYVGFAADQYKVPANKILIVNSEAMVSGDRVIPQMFFQDESKITRASLPCEANRFAEGEGASVANAINNNDNKSCLIVSNDTDSIMYALLAGNLRRGIGDEFLNEFWIQISHTSSTGNFCSSNDSVGEFWDINKLIYALETTLTELRFPIYDVVVIYLSAGTDFTDKWHYKTHEKFFSVFLRNKNFIVDLVKECDGRIILDHDAYLRLICAVWSSDDKQILSFEEIREKSMKKADIRLHLPHIDIVKQVGLRVDGTLRYMLSYINLNEDIPHWSDFGFVFKESLEGFVPHIYPDFFTPGSHNYQASFDTEIRKMMSGVKRKAVDNINESNNQVMPSKSIQEHDYLNFS